MKANPYGHFGLKSLLDQGLVEDIPVEMTRSLLIGIALGSFLVFGTLPSFSQAARPAGVSDEELFGTVVRQSKWQTTPIRVCWENPSEADAQYRFITRTAVEETWERHSAVQFVGWGTCLTNSDQGIHIRISDEGPHTKGLGRYLNQRPQGMVLNFTFNDWRQSCSDRKEYCAYVIAVHEFGHALGFAHEQNRDDAPAECREENKQGSVGDYNVTKYDPNSVMNYCNPAWSGDGKLSELDIEAVQLFYGK